MGSVWLAFVTGLTTGGISCLAVQGGLLASAVTAKSKADPESSLIMTRKWGPVALFLIAKVISHALLGFALGLVGSRLVLTPNAVGMLQIFVGLYLLATAARIVNLHPLFRYTVLQPPVWTYRYLKMWSRDPTWIAPLALGFFTVLMPCGVTQAMMVIAIATGNPVLSAGIMSAFVLGTSPVFFLLGITLVGFLQKKLFSYVAAGVVVIFGLLSINGGLVMRGSIYTFQNFYRAATTDTDSLAYVKGAVAGISDSGKQEATIYVSSNGYRTSVSTLKVGIPVNLTLISDHTESCARAFTIPEYNISKILPVNGTDYLEFTPQKTGLLTFACSMGMYTGSFTVVP